MTVWGAARVAVHLIALYVVLMTIESAEELAGMRNAGRVVATVLKEMIEAVEPGMTTAELDAFGATRLAAMGGHSAPIQTYNFPGATCISVNEGVAHGVPGELVIQPGDMVNIDVSAEVDGWWADNGGSTVVGEPTNEQARLLKATREARDRAIAAIRPGVPFSTVGRIFEMVAKQYDFNLVRNLCSHGIGRALHEPPRELYPYYRRMERRKFELGQVIALEPFMTTGRGWVDEGDDGWTLFGSPGSISAQFEHTIVVNNDGAEILTVAA